MVGIFHGYVSHNQMEITTMGIPSGERLQQTMERSTMLFMGKLTISTGPFSMSFFVCLPGRVHGISLIGISCRSMVYHQLNVPKILWQRPPLCSLPTAMAAPRRKQPRDEEIDGKCMGNLGKCMGTWEFNNLIEYKHIYMYYIIYICVYYIYMYYIYMYYIYIYIYVLYIYMYYIYMYYIYIYVDVILTNNWIIWRCLKKCGVDKKTWDIYWSSQIGWNVNYTIPS